MRRLCVFMILMSQFVAGMQPQRKCIVIPDEQVVSDCSAVIPVFGEYKQILEVILEAQGNPESFYADVPVYRFTTASIAYYDILQQIKECDVQAICNNRFVFIRHPKNASIDDDLLIITEHEGQAQEALQRYKKQKSDLDAYRAFLNKEAAYYISKSHKPS